MSNYQERFNEHVSRLNGNEEAAIYYQFEPLISEEGLATEPEFYLPPNEYDIVGGIADSHGDECAIICAHNCEVGQVVSWDEVLDKVNKVKDFLDTVNDSHSDTMSSIAILRNSFKRASRNISLEDNTLLILLTPGVVSESIKLQARDANIRTEILDLNKYNGSSEVTTLDVNFSSFGEEPQLIDARNAAEDHEVYMGVISGNTLANLYNRFGIPLLEGNVRHFLGQVGPNKGIARTIAEEPERFCSYNNGITVVAEDAKIENGKLITAKGISIVNGGQTSVSVFKAMKKGNDLTKIHVPMKFIRLKVDNQQARKSMLELISLYSNTQSKVNDADRMVNMPPHPELQQISQRDNMRSGAEGWFYERRRGEVRTKQLTMSPSDFATWSQKFPEKNVIRASSIGIAWNSWWGSPHVGAMGKNRGFIGYHSELSMRISKRSWKPEQFYKKTIALSMINNFTSDYMANNFAGLRSATLPHVLGWFSKLCDNRLDLIEIWKKGELPQSVKDAIISIAGIVDNCIRNYQDDDQKQWAKSAGCTETIWDLPKPTGFPSNLPMMRDGRDTQGDPAQYVMDIGKDKLWVMYRWGKANAILFQGNQMLTDIIIKTVSKNRKPSLAQANVILRAWQACCAAGFDPDEDYPEYQKSRR